MASSLGFLTSSCWTYFTPLIVNIYQTAASVLCFRQLRQGGQFAHSVYTLMRDGLTLLRSLDDLRFRMSRMISDMS